MSFVQAVFFDRDGVLTHPKKSSSGLPISPLEGEALEIVNQLEAPIRKLHDSGVYLFVVSNQPEVARERLSHAWLEFQDGQLNSAFPLHRIANCTHDSIDKCHCRKPRTGMLEHLAAQYDLDPQRTVFVGDRATDIQAGNTFGSKCIFVDHNYSEAPPSGSFIRVTSTVEACSQILRWEGKGQYD